MHSNFGQSSAKLTGILNGDTFLWNLKYLLNQKYFERKEEAVG